MSQKYEKYYLLKIEIAHWKYIGIKAKIKGRNVDQSRNSIRQHSNYAIMT